MHAREGGCLLQEYNYVQITISKCQKFYTPRVYFLLISQSHCWGEGCENGRGSAPHSHSTVLQLHHRDMQLFQLMLQEKKRCWIISCRNFIDSARRDTCHIHLYFIVQTQSCGPMYVQVSWQIQGDKLECFTLFPLLLGLSVQERTWVCHMKLLVCN